MAPNLNLRDVVTPTITSLELQNFLPDNRKLRRSRLDEIITRLDHLPVIDRRSADEILGYTEEGLFGSSLIDTP